MPAWSDYRDGFLRYLLGDEKVGGGSTTVIDDAMLLYFANETLRVLDGFISPVAHVSLPAQATHTLPSDFVAVLSLTAETPQTSLQSLTQVHFGEGHQPIPLGGSHSRYYLLHYPGHGQLTIVPTPTTSFVLRYRRRWPTITGDSFNLDFSPWSWLAAAAGYHIGYLAYTALAARRARLEPFSQRPELNVGNPLAEQAEQFYKMYQRALQAHGVHV